MPTLSQPSGYATLALGYIANAKGKPVLVREIASACELPAPYLAKLINKLAKAGIVTTQRGLHGGVLLAREPGSITLRDVCVALGDPMASTCCLLGIEQCSDERACPAHKFNIELRRQLLEYIDSTTIADIAAFEFDYQTDSKPSPGSDLHQI